jgi:hypothetical protein
VATSSQSAPGPSGTQRQAGGPPGLDDTGPLRDELAKITADTGWHCWLGVIPILYARREGTSPPWIVRAPDPEALREAIAAYPVEIAAARERRLARQRAETGDAQ